MKRIYFIRHAKAEKTTADDFQRDLSQKGKEAIKLMAKILNKNQIFADLIISSPAKRAIKTAQIIAKEIKFKNDILQIKSLYNCSMSTLLGAINSIEDTFNTVFIIGHNPAISEVCEFLSDCSIGSMPTSGICCIEFDSQSFSELKEHHGHIVLFDYPKRH